jgi:methyltransferase
MSVLWIVLALVAIQRCAELVYAQRNTRRLLARGGVEIGAKHYPLFIILHASWLIAMLVVIAPDTPPNCWLLGIFALLQVTRVWVVRTLGPYWTTRIVTVPDAPLIRTGPYRFVRHPNYIVVILEIAILPFAFGAPYIALVFTLLNAALLTYRIRMEETAIAPRRNTTLSS